MSVTGTGKGINMKRQQAFAILLGLGLSIAGNAVLQATASGFIANDEHDSVKVSDLLIRDTLMLKIDGPNDVAFYMNGVVFLSNTKFHQHMIPDHIAFGVVKSYFTPLDFIASESSHPLFKNDDFPYSPGGTSYSRDYQRVFFTKFVDEGGPHKVEKIFEMDILNGEGSNHRMLDFCEPSARYLHPAVSADGSFMVFASDLAPSSGGLDLFYTKKSSEGWSKPLNLGKDINSSSHEWYPFLDQHNNLYFSSAGKMGYGGYDIYICPFNGSSWDKPQNLSDYVNTNRDELGFSIHPARKMAVYSRAGDELEPDGAIVKMSLNTKAFLITGIDDERAEDIALLMKDMASTGFTASDTMILSGGGQSPPDHLFSDPLLSDETDDTREAEKETPENAVAESPVSDTAEERASIPDELPESMLSIEPTTQVESEELARAADIVKEAESPSEPKKTASTEARTGPAEKLLDRRQAAVISPLALTKSPSADEPPEEESPDENKITFRVQILSSTRAGSKPSITLNGREYKTFEYYYKGAYRVTAGSFSDVKEALRFRTVCKKAGFNQAFVAAFRGKERELDPSVFRQ